MVRSNDGSDEEEYSDEPSQASILSISSDEESDNSFRAAPPAPAAPARKNRVIISDDEDSDGIVEVVPTHPKMPIPQPAPKPKASSALPPPKAMPVPQVASNAKAGPSFPLPEPYRPSKPDSRPDLSGKSYNKPVQPRVVSLDWENTKALASKSAPYSSGGGMSAPVVPKSAAPMPTSAPRKATPIGAPVPGARKPDIPVASDDDYEENLSAHVQEGYDPKKTSDEATKDIHEFLAGALNSDDTQIDMTRARVKGLSESIVLKPHQVLSRDWMREREEGKKAGGILADDMGLGKTLQSIVRIVDGREKGQAPTLVVTPTSVVSQWADEIKLMAPSLRVMTHQGPSRTRDEGDIERHHVVVTSYPVVMAEYRAYSGGSAAKGVPSKKKKAAGDSDDSDESEAEHFGRKIKAATKRAPAGKKKVYDVLFKVEFHRVILDEAHTIKNRLAQTTKACWALDSKKRWCLTGTPMQNGIEELFPLIHFIGVRPYNDWDRYKMDVAQPIKAGRSGTAMKRLQVVLKGIMLRRLKTDLVNGRPIIELPAREVKVVHCDFDEDERSFYDALAAKIEIAVSKFQRQGTVTQNYTAILTLLLRLRQACNHPGLVTKDFSKDKDAIETRAADVDKEDPLQDDDADALADALAGLTVERKCTICLRQLDSNNSSRGDKTCSDCTAQLEREKRRTDGEYDNPNLPPTSAKIRKIIALLKETHNDTDEKTIIFSQFTSFLDLLEEFLAEEGIKSVRLDGSMKMDERQASLNKIKTSKTVRVILISFKAGSTGLNLTCCSRVILVDLWWNPALEEQAFDRAHRLGQTRDVKISKLTIENTVEERILELQEKKREIARAALSGDKIKGNKLSMAELMNLFKPGSNGDDADED